MAPTSYQISIDGVVAGEVAVGEEYTLPVGTADGFVCYTDGSEYFAEETTLTPEKNLSLTSVSIGKFEMLEGASMRINNKTGIRFYTNVDTAKIAELLADGATISIGTLIAPENLLNGNELKLDIPETNRVNIPFVPGVEDGKWYTEDTFSGMVGSLVNIKDANILRKFVGRGYATVTIGGVTKTVYADYSSDSVVNNTRSIAFIAKSLADSGSDLYIAHKDEVDKFAAMYNAAYEF